METNDLIKEAFRFFKRRGPRRPAKPPSLTIEKRLVDRIQKEFVIKNPGAVEHIKQRNFKKLNRQFENFAQKRLNSMDLSPQQRAQVQKSLPSGGRGLGANLLSRHRHMLKTKQQAPGAVPKGAKPPKSKDVAKKAALPLIAGTGLVAGTQLGKEDQNKNQYPQYGGYYNEY